MIDRRRLLSAPLVLALSACTLSACTRPATDCRAGPIVVDVGHTPDAPGTVSASGVTELTFNRRFAGRLVEELGRLPGQSALLLEIDEPDPRLDRRVAAIAAAHPSLIVSIHHDSVQERYLTRHTVAGRELTQTDAAAGFSLFVPAGSEVAAGSLHAARTIADGLIAAGEHPSLHHAEPIDGENRHLLDAGRGIYAGDFLKILRTAPAPAVLIEVGVVKNPAEERRLSAPATIDRLAAAMAGALTASTCP